jgi:SPP1 gp7 family putative phage head morphogenesis protein
MPLTLIRKLVDDPVQATADRLQGGLRRAYLGAVNHLKDKVDLTMLAGALARGDYEAAVRILGIDEGFASVLEGAGVETSLRDAVQQVYQEATEAALAALPKAISLGMSFDLMNQRSVDFIRGYTFHLIHGISEEARQTVRQTLLRAFQEGGHPFQQARAIRDSIGLSPRQERAVANYRSALVNRSGIALQRQLRDRRFDPTVENAIQTDSALAPAQVDRLVQRYQERYVDHRAKTIARTETIRAANHGQREVWRQAQEQDLIKPQTTERVWIVSGDSDTCDECDSYDGETVDVDDEFPDGDPPLHPNCRCTTALQFDVEKRDRVYKRIVFISTVQKYSPDQDRDDHGRFAGSAGGALEEIHGKYPANPENPKERLLMAAGKPAVAFEVGEREGRLRLHGIRSLVEEEHTGLGSLALRRLTNVADRHGVTMELTASPYGEQRMTGDELRAWYGRHGFEMESGFDPAYGYMIRKPTEQK